MAPADIPRLADAGISWEAVGFGIVLSLVTALACSLAPAVIATRMNLETLLREGGVRLTGSRRGRRMQNLFTMGQVAVTAVLLTASTLVVISVRAMLKTDTGFANLDTVTMNLALRGPQMDEARRRIFYTRLMDALRHSPAVTGVGAVLVRPLEGTIGWDMPYRSQSESSKRPEELPVANFEVITPGYFQTVGTPLLKGRDFGEQDREDTEKTVIISQDLARRVTRQGQVPLGTRLQLSRHSGDKWWKVVGVAANTRYRSITTRGEDIYVSYRQSGIPVNYLVVRGRGTASDLTSLVRKEVNRLDSSQAVANVATIRELVDRDTGRQRFNMALLMIFGFTALILAAAGVYSVVAENASARSREIAIRLALGADRVKLVHDFSAGILSFVLAGEFIGLLLTLAASAGLSGLLYGTQARDPLVLGSVLTFLFVVSVFAASVPAWIAAGQDPKRFL